MTSPEPIVSGFRSIGVSEMDHPDTPSPQHSDTLSSCRSFLERELVPHLNGNILAEFRSLSRETDAELFYEALYHFGQRLERRERMGEAGLVYSAVASAEIGTVQQLAQSRLNLFNGNGSFGEQLEMAGRGFARQALSPTGILTMAGAQVAGGLTTFRVLAGLRRFPVTTLLGRPLVARTIAGGASTVVETGAFMGIHHGFSELLGLPQVHASLSHEFWSTLLTIAPLKFSSFAAHSAINRLHGSSIFAQAVPTGFLQRALPSASMFGGIYLGLEAQSFFDLRPRSSTGNTLFEAFHTFFHFHVAGKLMQDYLGTGFQQFNRDLHLRTERLRQKTATPRRGASGSSIWETVFSGPSQEWATPEGIRLPSNAVAMVSIEGNGGRRQNGNGGEASNGRNGAAGIWRSHLLSQPRAPTSALAKGFIAYNPESTPQIYEKIRNILPEVPPEATCLLVELYGRENGLDAEPLRKNLGEILESHPTLEEIRLATAHGHLTWVVKSEGRIFSEAEGQQHRGNPLLKGTDIRPGKLFRVTMLPPWQRYGGDTPLHFLLQRSRMLTGLSLESVLKRFQNDSDFAREIRPYKYKLGAHHLREFERSTRRPIPFPILKRLAEYYGEDIRRLIVASNETLYPEIPRHQWSTEDYPLYLESKADLRRLHYFQKAPRHHAAGSIGWLIYAMRKNPFRYIHYKDLAEQLGIHPNGIPLLESNHRPPTFETIAGFARAFVTEPETIVDAVNSTFYQDLPLRSLFRWQSIHLRPHSKDEELVRYFQNSPGTLGQFLFAYRKTLHRQPTSEDLALSLARHDDYWRSRELNQVPITPDNLHDWVWLFRQIKLPFELLEYFSQQQAGITRESPAWLLAEALKSKTYEQVAEKAAIGQAVLISILHGHERTLKPATLLAIKEVLPDLNTAKLYRHFHPMIEKIFPEAVQGYLSLTPEFIHQTFEDFHLGERLFAFRMNPPEREGLKPYTDGTLDSRGLGRLLRISETSAFGYENTFAPVEKETTLQQIAQILEVDPRWVYLHFRPELLRLFPIRHPETGEPISINRHQYLRYLAGANLNFDRENLRRRLTPIIHRSQRKVSLADGTTDFPATLASDLGIEVAQTQKFFDRGRFLNVDDIRKLSEAYPSLSYQKWYEHFYRPALAYFLGRKLDGNFNYEIPEGQSWSHLDAMDIAAYIRKGYRYPELTAKGRRKIENILQLIRQGKPVSNNAIVSLARLTGLNPRLLFFYFRRHELRPMLEAHILP